MKHVLIACVNYNSYRELINYLRSIETSLKLVDELKVDVVVADNSTNRQNIECDIYKRLKVEQVFFENIGYFLSMIVFHLFSFSFQQASTML